MIMATFHGHYDFRKFPIMLINGLYHDSAVLGLQIVAFVQ